MDEWKKYMSKEEFLRLPHVGRVMAEYWSKWLPKTCKRLQQQGKNLREYFETEGYRIADRQLDLMQEGMSEDGAWEIVREEIFLPPEV